MIGVIIINYRGHFIPTKVSPEGKFQAVKLPEHLTGNEERGVSNRIPRRLGKCTCEMKGHGLCLGDRETGRCP